jgi:hypothetical protein
MRTGPPTGARAARSRRSATDRVSRGVAVRSPQLYESLRNFCLAAFSLLQAEVDAGAEIPFAFEEHDSAGRTTFYEFRPLLVSFVDSRSGRIGELADAKLARERLEAEPAAAIFARAHAGARVAEEEALLRIVLLPLLADTAESCGGFDWDDTAFERHYAELESALYGSELTFVALAPLIGLSAAGRVELGDGIAVRTAATGEVSRCWPEAGNLLPEGFGREPDRLCVLELERKLEKGSAAPPDSAAELADALTALRLALGGSIAQGPVVFERLDWRPYGIRPAVPIAAAVPPGHATRLDAFRARLARDLRERIASADPDPELADALDRWELSLFQDEPFRAEQLRAALEALLGGGDGLWAATLRAAVLVGEVGRERAEKLAELRSGDAGPAVREALVEALAYGDRVELIEALDETLLGLRPRPAIELAAEAV